MFYSSSQQSDTDLFESQELLDEIEPSGEFEPMTLKAVFLPNSPSQQISTHNSNSQLASADPFNGLTQFRFANHSASFKSRGQPSANEASTDQFSANQEPSSQSRDMPSANQDPYSLTQGNWDVSQEFVCSPPTPQNFPKTQVRIRAVWQ